MRYGSQRSRPARLAWVHGRPETVPPDPICVRCPAMSLSIRNQLPGTVTTITPGEVMDAVKDLGLAEGSAVRALVKSTEVSLATGRLGGLSIRNQLSGTVGDIATG